MVIVKLGYFVENNGDPPLWALKLVKRCTSVYNTHTELSSNCDGNAGRNLEGNFYRLMS